MSGHHVFPSGLGSPDGPGQGRGLNDAVGRGHAEGLVGAAGSDGGSPNAPVRPTLPRSWAVPRAWSVRVRLMVGVSTLVALISIALSLAAPVAVKRALVSDIVTADAQLSAGSIGDIGGVVSMVRGLGMAQGLEPVLEAAVADALISLGPVAEELRARSHNGVVVVAIDRSTVVLLERDGSARVQSGELGRLGVPVVAARELFALSGEVGGGAGLLAEMMDAFGSGRGGTEPGGFPDSMMGGMDRAELDAMLGDDLRGMPVERMAEIIAERVGSAASVSSNGGEGPADLDPYLGGSAELTWAVHPIDGVSYVVGAPLDGVARSVDRVRQWLRWSVPITVLLAGLVTWLLAGRALRPVRAITEQAARIGAGTLHERVPVPPTRDEIATLALTVNEMLARLETHDSRHRRFVSDASHELRSPVAVLRTAADVALQPGADLDATALARRVRVEADRMGAMISDLLTLARHDEGGQGPTIEVDLDDLLLEEAARPRRVPIDVRAVSAGRVRGRPAELRRMVTHLLDNAARHADMGVWVSLGPIGLQVQLTVQDDGAGIPAEHRTAIFERFVRLDEARTRDGGGAGLGLAVVVSVVEGLGGTVAVDDAPNGGARFVVTLPAVG